MTGGVNVQQLGWSLSTYKLGCKLVGDRTAKSCYLMSSLNHSL